MDAKPDQTGSDEKPGNKAKRKHVRVQQPKTRFEGACTELKGHVFDCPTSKASQVDDYTKTLEALVVYVGQEYGPMVGKALETLTMPTLTEPPSPPDGASEWERDKCKQKYAMYLKKLERLEENIQKTYALIWGQCSDVMRTRLQEMDGFQANDQEMNAIELMRLIKNVAFDYRTHEHPGVAARKSMYQFYRLTQGKGQSVQQYLETFQNMVEVLDTIGCNVETDGLVELVLKESNVTIQTANEEQKSAARKTAKQQYLAISFLLGADRQRFGGLIEDLANDYLMGTDNYPQTVTECFTLLNHWSRDPKNLPSHTGSNSGVAFTNVDNDALQCSFVNSGQKPKYNGPPCTRCGRKNHGDDSCIAKTHMDGTILMTYGTKESGIMFTQRAQESLIPDNWVLLDNQSTVDVFANANLLRDIYQSDQSLTVHCNAGMVSTSQRGILPGYGHVWYNPNGIANILSLSRVKERYPVVYNSDEGNEFEVHGSDGIYHFRESPQGLYYINGHVFRGMADVTMVNTVAHNSTNYSRHDYLQAKLARRLQVITGRPSTRTLINALKGKAIINCPVTERDVIAAEKIFGPDVGALKGKTVRRKPEGVRVSPTNIPMDIMATYGKITLCVDIMRVNKIPFMVTISQHIGFGTCERLENLKLTTLFNSIKTVAKIYRQRGFHVQHVRGDNEFSPMRGDLASIGMQLNEVARDEHVPEVERYIRTIKERSRAIYNTLPFNHYPPSLIVELVYTSVFWLNMFPTNGGIGDHSPAYLVAGRQIDFTKHCQLEFGEYVQTHEEHDNSMQTRTVGALALRPTGNAQGGHYFFNLNTGRRIIRRQWTALPMPQQVIDQVHRIARRANGRRTLEFQHDIGVYVGELGELIDDEDSDDDETYEPPEDDSDGSSNSVSSDSDDDDDDDEDDASNEDSDGDNDEDGIGEDDELHLEAAEDEQEDHETDHSIGPQHPDDDDVEIAGVVEEDDDSVEIAGVAESKNDDDHGDSLDGDNEEVAQLDEDVDPFKRTTLDGRVLRSRPRMDYKELHHGTTMTMSEARQDEIVLVTPQLNFKQGLKAFGDRGELAVGSELKQVHDMKGIKPRHKSELTALDQARALRYLMYLKEKRDGTIKARGCADGRKQRLWTNKEDASSPTVSLGALILSCVIDALEGRHVVTLDVPGAFLQTSMDGEETVHILLEGKMAELMCKVDPATYSQYLFQENGKTYMYVELTRALYGTLKAALLFWMDLCNELIKMGFTINPYDWCVANKDVNGTQCTVVWHVDDLKISHKDPAVIQNVVDNLSERYGQVSPLTMQRGKTHEYLGMTITYPGDGSVCIGMISYIEAILAEAPADMDGVAETPAADHLFSVMKDQTPLDTADAEFFHHMTAKLLFLCKRARPDIQTAVAFLCTRVKGPDIDDFKKLKRVIRYLRKTRALQLRLLSSDLTKSRWWVDGAFAVHGDMRSHTGAFFSLGHGAMYSCSNKQKLNTKSSTEAELVAVDDIMGQALWTQYFLEHQGHNIQPITIYQDNQSAMLLERNGRASSSKRTRHVNIRYYFVTDRISKGEAVVCYCPTGDMIGDFFTKPLQGSKFRQFRDIIMGWSAPNWPDNVSGAQECVENRADSHLSTEFNMGTRAKDVPSRDEVQGPRKVTWADIVSGRQFKASQS